MTSSTPYFSSLSPDTLSILSPSCNAPKHAYDTCFNAWFKDYLLLVSPPLSAPSDRTKRDKQVEQMKAQYDKNCKGFYDSYQSCLQVRRVFDIGRGGRPRKWWGCDGRALATLSNSAHARNGAYPYCTWLTT